MELRNLGKVLDTDVLILGSGAAGCCAALAACEQGSGVLLVDKGKLESSGSAGGGNDHFMANLNSGPEWDADETLVNFFSRTLAGITKDIIDKRWVKVIPVILRFLEDIGVEYVRNPDGSCVRTVGFGQPGPWWLNIKNGQLLKRLIAKKLRSMNVNVLDHVMVTRLLKNGDKVAGAVGFNVVDGNFYILRAKTVVLALGIEANRATNNSTPSPFNVWLYPYNTGSNTVMAYNAGAKIFNLELTEIATLLPKGFGCPGMNGLNSMGGHELNAFGERFMSKYDPVFLENTIRRKQVAATYQELIDGKGPPFYMDMRHLSSEDIDLLQNVLMPGDKATFGDYLKQKEISFATHPLEVEISELILGGRILINDRLESTVSGLFSACNFFALSGAMCGGYSAGIEAANMVLKIDRLSDIDSNEVIKEKEQVFRPLGKSRGPNPREFENVIRQVMNYYMGHVRNQKGIETALEKLNLIERHINYIKATNYHELMRANEARHLLKHCQLSTRAVLERKESGRTIYRRSDYPDSNKELNKCLVIWQENGEPKISFESPL